MEQRDVIIIGSGCAGFAVADRLLQFGVNNVLLMTENINAGTSRNTGSDKQTYYKADLTGGKDSIYAMTKAIYDGGAIDGEKALVEAVNSLRCFFYLEEKGMEFPIGAYGEYIGYKTDHDDSSRATSIGPLTSKKMTQVLEKSVLNKKLDILDKAYAVQIACEDTKVQGVFYLDLSCNQIQFVQSKCVIMAVGGSAVIYKNSVYPKSQHGSLSLALDAGCSLHNITEWQYGIASTSFRWNLSGSYQQVIPKYVSVDANGVKREFLFDYFKNSEEMYESVFLKGYEWPFDSRKRMGSSRVDLAVIEELKKGRRVYLDYKNNPSDLRLNADSEAYRFWEKSGVDADTPIARLQQLNPQAVRLYKNHNIDLAEEMLEIAVCAQHCNGGVAVDSDFQTNIKGLFVIGEASGNFGMYRPGGTALNSTQVGALRVAQYIANNLYKYSDTLIESDGISDSLNLFIENHIDKDENVSEIMNYFREKFSTFCGINRDIDALVKLKSEIGEYLLEHKRITIVSKKHSKLLFECFDMLKTQYVMINSAIHLSEVLGSRGGAVTTKNSVLLKESEDSEEYIIESNYKEAFLRKRNPIPKKEYQFEKILNRDSLKTEILYE